MNEAQSLTVDSDNPEMWYTTCANTQPPQVLNLNALHINSLCLHKNHDGRYYSEPEKQAAIQRG